MSLIDSFDSMGPKGPKGDKGDTGDTGATGPRGASGAGCRNYTTSEQDTGLTWINGKKIYQKTILFGTVVNKSVPHNISNLDMVIRMDTMSTQPSTNSQIMMDGCFFNLDLCAYFMRNGSNINCVTNTDITNQEVYVTLWYTKTTD